MNKTDKIYRAFIMLSLLIWNPFSFRWIYRDSYCRGNTALLVFFSMATLLGLFALYRLSRNTMSEKMKNYLFSLSFLSIMFFLLVLTDKAVGYMQARQIKNRGPVITEDVNLTARYQSSEFDYTAHFNSIGIRDNEIGPKNRYRIICVGDSWTYGWGVQVEQSWPKLLERLLNERGIRVEVISVARPGAHPVDYKNYLEKALPLLKPDLAIIGINQHDDLSQLYEFNCALHMSRLRPDPGSVWDILEYAMDGFFKESTKHIRAARIRKEVKPDEIRVQWKNDVEDMIRNAHPMQRKRYFALPDTLRAFYESGNYSSGNFFYNMYYPERKFVANNPQSPATIRAIGLMKSELEAMLQLCKPYRCQLIFANLPNAEFTGHRSVRLPELDIFNAELEKNNKIDSMYRDLTARLQIPYIELTAHFRALPDKTAYFYVYDNHPNEKGYAEIAAYISSALPGMMTIHP